MGVKVVHVEAGEVLGFEAKATSYVQCIIERVKYIF